jgi:hypothetical protein
MRRFIPARYGDYDHLTAQVEIDIAIASYIVYRPSSAVHSFVARIAHEEDEPELIDLVTTQYAFDKIISPLLYE